MKAQGSPQREKVKRIQVVWLAASKEVGDTISVLDRMSRNKQHDAAQVLRPAPWARHCWQASSGFGV